MGLTLTTAPAAEPLDLSTVKLQLKQDIDVDDSLITGLIKSARIFAENRIRRKFITQTWEYTLDRLPANNWGFPIRRYVHLPFPPLQSVTSLVYYDTSGNQQTLDSSNYYVDTTNEPGRITLQPYKIWPITQVLRANAATITFTCGYGAASDVPQNLLDGMMLLINHWYTNRSSVVTGTIATQVPQSALDLIDMSSFGFYA